MLVEDPLRSARPRVAEGDQYVVFFVPGDFEWKDRGRRARPTLPTSRHSVWLLGNGSGQSGVHSGREPSTDGLHERILVRKRLGRHRSAKKLTERPPAISLADSQSKQVRLTTAEVLGNFAVVASEPCQESVLVEFDRSVQPRLRELNFHPSVLLRRVQVLESRSQKLPHAITASSTVSRSGSNPVCLRTLGKYELRSRVPQIQVPVHSRHGLVRCRFEVAVEEGSNRRPVNGFISQTLQRRIEAGGSCPGKANPPHARPRNGGELIGIHGSPHQRSGLASTRVPITRAPEPTARYRRRGIGERTPPPSVHRDQGST